MVVLNRATRITFSQSQRSKNSLKKGYMEMSKNFYLETLKSVLGSSIIHYCFMYQVIEGPHRFFLRNTYELVMKLGIHIFLYRQLIFFLSDL